jgi:hypothetical protein
LRLAHERQSGGCHQDEPEQPKSEKQQYALIVRSAGNFPALWRCG